MAGSRNLNGGLASGSPKPGLSITNGPGTFSNLLTTWRSSANQGQKRTYVVTGDSGNRLTHGVLSSHLIADEIERLYNPWAELYNPSRLSSMPKPCQHAAA